MPGNPFSAFEYAGYGCGTLGSIFASSLAGGCDYNRYYSYVRYGGYWQLPLNNLGRIDTMSFLRIGDTKDRPVGDQMRLSRETISCINILFDNLAHCLGEGEGVAIS